MSPDKRLKANDDKDASQKVSILIASKERRSSLDALIHDLLAEGLGAGTEIIVVEETDADDPIPGITYIRIPTLNKGIPYARNLCASHANGEILVFVDDDCNVQSAWLEKLVAPFSDPDVVGVQGGVVPTPGAGAVGWAELLLGFPGGGVKRIANSRGKQQETVEISTLNCAYRTDVFRQIGGFDENLKLGAEDYLFAKQACAFGRCLFVPSATVAHEPRGSLFGNFFWFVRRGRAEIALMRTGKQRHTNVLTMLRSSILVKLMLLFVVSFVSGIPLYAIMILGMGVYTAEVWRKHLKVWRESNAPSSAFMMLPLVKLIMDTGMDTGRIRELGHG